MTIKLMRLLANQEIKELIRKELGEERRLVSYHLEMLEESGFLTSKYEISEEKKSKGRALRKYTVADKVAKVISELKKEL